MDRARMIRVSIAIATASLATAAVAASVMPSLQRVPDAVPAITVRALPLHIGGRVQRTADGYVRQWPGTYFEAMFTGDVAYLKTGAGAPILHVTVDGTAVAPLVRPAPGYYRITGLSAGTHRVRVDVATEHQATPTVFGGIYAGGRTHASTPPKRARQIEFIGDSHTVGYANLSDRRECSEAEIADTTDTAQGMPALTARRYDADYQVNAISGRGIVRNYGGGAGDTLPVAYPFVLFDKAVRYRDPAWAPRLIVIALGTNDFTTPLHVGERWPDRAALHADYEARYVAFVKTLRQRDPKAHIVLWATDMADGEIAREVGRVAARLTADGVRDVGYVPVNGLALSSCNAHPSVADDQTIAAALSSYINAHPAIWRR